MGISVIQQDTFPEYAHFRSRVLCTDESYPDGLTLLENQKRKRAGKKPWQIALILSTLSPKDARKV